ncbi:uncharacterized protein AAES06_010208 isoform 1-T2 [Glossophaga mutica]
MTVTGQTDRLRPDVKLRTDGSGAVGSAGSSALWALKPSLTASFIEYLPGPWRGCNAGSQGSSPQPELTGNIQNHRLSSIVPDPREPGANCAPRPAGMSLLWPMHLEQGVANVYVSWSRVPGEAKP